MKQRSSQSDWYRTYRWYQWYRTYRLKGSRTGAYHVKALRALNKEIQSFYQSFVSQEILSSVEFGSVELLAPSWLIA